MSVERRIAERYRLLMRFYRAAAGSTTQVTARFRKLGVKGFFQASP